MRHKHYNINLALGFDERYDHRIAIGIIRFARSRSDWRLIGNARLWKSNPESPADRPHGIIARITNREELARFLAYKVPIVDIADAFDDRRLFRALNDDRMTGHLAGRHLVACGFRHFAYVGIDEVSWSGNRLWGLDKATGECRQSDLHVFRVGVSWLKREYRLDRLANWLKKLPLPCGVMAANDLLGYRISVAAAMAGLSIPNQLGVIGVDNEALFCELAQPSLTSILCDCDRIGWEAANLLWRALNKEAPVRTIIVPPLEVAQKESTRIAVGEDETVRSVRKYIRENIGSGVNVAEVAAAFPLSRRTLEKHFRQQSGQTLNQEIVAAKLEKACRLLEQGMRPVAVAKGSGFSTLQHFYFTFRKFMGMTPLAYGKRAAAENLESMY